MAESQKRDCSVSAKEKDTLQDLEIGKDFLTSWKSVSMAEEDGLDFDLTPVPKSNKKPFDFDKADMDFNLDGDFGKISSFNMDMSDLDISPPLKKDGKSKEKLKESSSGKDTGKTDRFAFAFDFDELENFSFDSSLTKEGSKAQRDKSNKESFPSGSGCQDKERSTHMNVVGSTSLSEDRLQKPTLPETRITFDMNCLVGGSVDFEPTRKACSSNLAIDDTGTSEHSAAIGAVASDKAKIPPETIVSKELPNISRSKKLVSSGPFDLEASNGNDAIQDSSPDNLCNNEPSGDNPSEAQNKVDSMDTNATGSNGEQDTMISVSGSTCNYKDTESKNSQHLQTFAISDNIINEKSRDGIEDHVTDDRGRTELGHINSLVENSDTTSAVTGILSDTPSGKENQEPTSEILKLPLVSQPTDLSEKQTENGREPIVNCSRPSIQPEESACSLLKASSQTKFSSLSSKKMGFAHPSLVEGKRDENTIPSDRKLVSLPLQYSKTLQRGELPQRWSQESCNDLKISGSLTRKPRKPFCREVGCTDGLQNGKKLNDSSTTQIKDTVKAKSTLRQREMIMKDQDSLSMEINKKAAKTSENATTLASIPSTKNTPGEEHRLSSTEGRRKTPDLPGLKLSGLNLDSAKSPIRKDSKSVGNSSQKSILLRKTTSDIAYFPNALTQTPSVLSMKRTLEDDAASIIALHPSKRLSQSASTSRNFVETSEKVPNKKLPSHNHMEDDRIKSTIGNCQVTAFHVPHEVKNKGVEISFSIQNDSNIKLADAYSKELDDLRNILRKKQDEAKEILVRAIVNSNKLLMLNNPQFEEKIRATEDLFARLTFNSIPG